MRPIYVISTNFSTHVKLILRISNAYAYITAKGIDREILFISCG